MDGDFKTDPQIDNDPPVPEHTSGEMPGEPSLGKPALLSPRAFMHLSDREARRALRYGRPLSIAMVMIDGFKPLRDSLGKDGAMRIVDASVERIAEVLRGCDAAARLGQAEFGLVLPETSLLQASIAAERLRSAFEAAPLQSTTGSHDISLSIGLATLSPRLRNPKVLLMTACAELRRARRQGPNSICAAPPDTAKPTQRGNRQIH